MSNPNAESKAAAAKERPKLVFRAATTRSSDTADHQPTTPISDALRTSAANGKRTIRPR